MFAASKTAGAAAAVAANYIEDVFSTWLTTGTGGSNTQTVNNGVNLSTYGGLVWGKSRNVAGSNHILVDTARGVNTTLSTDNTGAQITSFPTVSSFLTTGFTATNYVNSLSDTFAFWTFRKQPKFFDVVTYTGNGTARSISHNLGSTPGCIIVKVTSTTDAWFVYHRSATGNLRLNTTAAQDAGNYFITGASSTTFDVGSGGSINSSGATYVAYLFAHNAGGFGPLGTENVISCGSYTGNGSTTGPTVNLSYEPQWLLVKNAGGSGNWFIFDNMRGIPTGGDTSYLTANLATAEGTALANAIDLSATGFQIKTTSSALNTSGSTYIYIAIRRGPMKVPTDATKVFAPVARAGTGTDTTVNAGFPVDLGLTANRTSVTDKFYAVDRLRGNKFLRTNLTSTESANAALYPDNPFDVQTALRIQGTSSNDGVNQSGFNYIDYLMRRAPGFFDEVCYTGTGSARTINHNLGVVPELMIVKNRANAGYGWIVYSAALGATNFVQLNSTGASAAVSTFWNNTAPTSTVFSVGTAGATNPAAGEAIVAYLFATCAGVSKVGSYTGNGTTQTIDCGFTGGARFVLIKRTDSTGGWYVYDTARGMTVLTDPYLLLNSTAAESATLGSVTTVTTGFAVNASILAAINTNAASYIFLAIA